MMMWMIMSKGKNQSKKNVSHLCKSNQIDDSLASRVSKRAINMLKLYNVQFSLVPAITMYMPTIFQFWRHKKTCKKEKHTHSCQKYCSLLDNAKSLSYCLFVNVFFLDFLPNKKVKCRFCGCNYWWRGVFFHVESLRFRLLTVQVVAACFIMLT